MRIAILLVFLTLSACGRPLSDAESRFAAQFHGPDLDTSKIRLRPAPILKLYSTTYPVAPRTTCARKLLPPPQGPTTTGTPAATVIFNTINVNPDFNARDYMPAYPDAALLLAAMFLAHELVHIWQWQNRDITNYHPLKAAHEHQSSPDPYLFDLANQAQFLDFGYEQQGAIAAEYVCCAALAPKAPRTARLERLLSAHFKLEDMTPQLSQTKMVLPWDGVEILEICS